MAFATYSCKQNKNNFDATGTFEATEVIVSSELGGKIITLTINEGDTVAANQIVGAVDAVNLSLQKEQVEASINSLSERTADVMPQIKMLENQLEVQHSQLANLEHEKKRTAQLIAKDAATGKQLDDINAQMDIVQKQVSVTQQQINVQRSAVNTQNKTVMSERKPLQKKVEQINDQIKRSNIINPASGTIITKYAELGEMTTPGKAMYKIADLSTMKLRAYITGDQLPQVKLGQQVKVFIDAAKGEYKELPGKITWISDKAEFTPKTIQTKDERANLVYAVKVDVKNDGYVKIGMYGEIKFQ